MQAYWLSWSVKRSNSTDGARACHPKANDWPFFSHGWTQNPNRRDSSMFWGVSLSDTTSRSGASLFCDGVELGQQLRGVFFKIEPDWFGVINAKQFNHVSLVSAPRRLLLQIDQVLQRNSS